MTVGPSKPPPKHDYFVFGLHLASDLELPELAGLPARNATAPLVTFRLGSAGIIASPQDIGTHYQSTEQEFLFEVKDVARYRINRGEEIIVEPAKNSSARNQRLYLLGSALGILCHQRGLLPLHANAIVANGFAIAFAGHSGAGKSTLAAHFQSRGYEILCDDVCVISFNEDGVPAVWPGLPRLKLWRDAVDTLGHGDKDLDRAVEGLEKFNLPLSRSATTGPYPLKRLYILNKAEDASGGIERILGTAALEAVMSQTYRGHFLKTMGRSAQHFGQAAKLLQHAQVYSAPRRWGYDVFAEEAEKLERHFAEATRVVDV
ncbi:MAG: hypothetical protein HY243_05240 [Proteobacteria bacterium]|nr:hypothetical protein [Pseudomonadota bacterium]